FDLSRAARRLRRRNVLIICLRTGDRRPNGGREQSSEQQGNTGKSHRCLWLRQTERDVNRGAEIDGLTVGLRGLETNAEGRLLGRFVETVAESAHDAQHPDVAAGGKFELERYRAFDARGARFVGVLRRG